MTKLWLTILFAIICFTGVNAQSEISGRVTDKNDEPIYGATVIVPEVQRLGVATSENGEFSIQVPEAGKTLLISFIGMQTQKIEIGNQTSFNIVMEDDETNMDEVVLIGYGTKRIVDLTGAIATIGGDQLSLEQPATIEQALKGKIAGVQVINTDGAPGSGVTIKVRGASSITAGSAPLYVIDGFPYPVSDDPLDNPLTNLSPNDIESITVLKDVASTAIYGAEGANGVIIVTTKSAKNGQAEWNFKASSGFSDLTKALPMMNPEDYMRSMMMEFYMRNQYHREEVDFYPEYAAQIWNTDPSRFKNYQDEVMRTGIRQMYELSFLGGSDIVKNSTFLSYMDDEGIAIKTGFERLYLKSDTNVKVSDKINFDANIQYSRATRTGLNWGLDGNGGIFNDVASFSPLIPKEWTFKEVDENLFFTGALDNPYRKLNDIDLKDVENRFSGQIRFNYNILKGLVFKVSASLAETNSLYKKFVPTTIRSSFENNGEAQVRTTNGSNYAYLAQLSYNFNIADIHKVSLLAGYEAKGNENESVRNDYTNFEPDLGWYGIYLAQSGSHVTPPEVRYNIHEMRSGLFSGDYNYDNRYLFKASVRADASSRFGPNNKWGVFPAAALGWRISEESFYQSSSFLTKYVSNAKLRLSFGQAGNNQIQDYLYSNTLAGAERNAIFLPNPGSSGDLYTGSNQNVIALNSPRIANPDVSWETTTEFNLGLDLGLFDNRINVAIDYYKKETSNMLLDQELAMISGYPSQTLNVGRLGAHGIELAINATPIQKEDFSWNLAFNISANRTKVLELSGDGDQFLRGRGIGNSNIDNILIKEGYPLGMYFGMQVEGIRNTYASNSNATKSLMWWFANEREAPYGFIAFADIDGDGSAELSD
ncbi:MAG: SusC/RagA family TonB-linked outer membrane protein, partial [Bacteroidetes bacterium]|nr:SusC/RagA family TonB-linked outer membrane protein [Bacteroidota bacterium]